MSGPLTDICNVSDFQKALAALRAGESFSAKEYIKKLQHFNGPSIDYLTDYLVDIQKISELSLEYPTDPLDEHQQEKLFTLVKRDFMAWSAWIEIGKKALGEKRYEDALQSLDHAVLTSPRLPFEGNYALDAFQQDLYKALGYYELRPSFHRFSKDGSSDFLGHDPDMSEFVEMTIEMSNRDYLQQKCETFWKERTTLQSRNPSEIVSAYISNIPYYLYKASAWNSSPEESVKAALYLIYELFHNKTEMTPEQRALLLFYRAGAQELLSSFDDAKQSLEEAIALASPDALPRFSRKYEALQVARFAESYKQHQFMISYIMPAHNRTEEQLHAAVESVLHQNSYAQETELIAVDNGNIEDIAAYLNKRYSDEVASGRLKTLRVRKAGTAAARNLGLQVALSGKPKYVTFLDSDDIALPDRTRKVVQFMDEHPEFAFGHARVECIAQDGRKVPDHPTAHYFRDHWKRIGNEPEDTYSPSRLFQSSCPINNQSVIVRAETLRNGNIYQNPLWERGEDMMCWLSIALQGARFGFLNEPVAQYRIKGLKLGIIGLAGIAEAHHRYYTERGHEIVAVADLSDKIAEEKGKQFGAQHLFSGPDAYKKLAKLKLDGISVCTPPSARKDIVCTLLEAGHNLLVEKPLAFPLEDAKAIADCLEGKENITAMGYIWRSAYTFYLLREAIARPDKFWGELQDARFIHRTGFVYQGNENWRTNPEQGGGHILEHMVHPINYVRSIFGNAEAVEATGKKSLITPRLYDVISARLWFPHRVSPVELTDIYDEKQSIGVNNHKPDIRIDCKFEKGTFVAYVEWGAPIYKGGAPFFRQYFNGEEITEYKMIHGSDEGVHPDVKYQSQDLWGTIFHQKVITNFIAALQGRAKPYSTLVDGYHDLQIAHAVRESLLHEGRKILL